MISSSKDDFFLVALRLAMVWLSTSGDGSSLKFFNSSLSGTREIKSANSLFAMAFGLSSFLVNLLVPQAIIKYLRGIKYRTIVTMTRIMNANQERKGTQKLKTLATLSRI